MADSVELLTGILAATRARFFGLFPPAPSDRVMTSVELPSRYPHLWALARYRYRCPPWRLAPIWARCFATAGKLFAICDMLFAIAYLS
jgi:hypothetical protein